MTRIELLTDSSGDDDNTIPVGRRRNMPIDENIFEEDESVTPSNEIQRVSKERTNTNNIEVSEIEMSEMDSPDVESEKLEEYVKPESWNSILVSQEGETVYENESASPSENFATEAASTTGEKSPAVAGTETETQSASGTGSKSRRWNVDSLDLGGVQLTPQLIMQLCKQHRLYQTPHLNDKLYLHHKGFRTLDTGALKEYANLKALWLEGNALKDLKGISHLTQMRCLYAHQNILEDLSALEGLSDLRTLNLSQNRLTTIPINSLSKWCPHLSNLNLSQNKFSTVESIVDVTQLQELSVLDLQDNKIEDESIVDHLVGMDSLSVLYLKGNPVVNKIKSYRKTLISKIKNLKYLDDRPVFDDERRLAMAWASSGIQGEQEERKNMAQEKKDKEKKDLENFRKWQKSARVKRLQRTMEDKMKVRISQLVRTMQFNFQAIATVINDEFRNYNPQEDTDLPVTDPEFQMEPFEEINGEKCRALFVSWKSYPYEKRQIPSNWSIDQKRVYDDYELRA